jgi:hypothetical protein
VAGKRSDVDFRYPSLRQDRRLSAPNTFRAIKWGPGWVEIECLVRITDQSQVVGLTLYCSNTRGHGTRGLGTRYMFRLDEATFSVESGLFMSADDPPVQLPLPRVGLVLTEVSPNAAWVKKFEEPAK